MSACQTMITTWDAWKADTDQSLTHVLHGARVKAAGADFMHKQNMCMNEW